MELRSTPSRRALVHPVRRSAHGAEIAAAVAQERARTRAWLHDRVLQSLEYLAAGAYQEEPSAEHLQDVARAAAQELRDYVEGPAGRQTDLAEALAGVIADVQPMAGRLSIGLVLNRVEIELEPTEVETLAAATREALNNALRHSRGARVVVFCTATRELIEVVIRDDGVGFDAEIVAPGHGLRNSITRRMLRAGGGALVESSPGAGTVVTLRLPAIRPSRDRRERAA
jgi:signal transduction histidine kinase